MVEFGFIRIGFGVGLGDTLGDDLWITFLVASVIAIRALHTRGVFEEFTTESTTHNVVKLLLNKLVAILFDNLFFTLTNGAFSTKSSIERRFVASVFHYYFVSTESWVLVIYITYQKTW